MVPLATAKFEDGLTQIAMCSIVASRESVLPDLRADNLPLLLRVAVQSVV